MTHFWGPFWDPFLTPFCTLPLPGQRIWPRRGPKGGPKKGPKMGHFWPYPGPQGLKMTLFWVHFGTPKMTYFGPKRGSSRIRPQNRGSQKGPKKGSFWASQGPYPTAPVVTSSVPFWLDNGILGIARALAPGPQGPKMTPFWDPILGPKWPKPVRMDHWSSK